MITRGSSQCTGKGTDRGGNIYWVLQTFDPILKFPNHLGQVTKSCFCKFHLSQSIHGFVQLYYCITLSNENLGILASVRFFHFIQNTNFRCCQVENLAQFEY